MAIKKDRLLIFKVGRAKTASGKDLLSITITRNDDDQFRHSEQYRDSDYTSVSTSYHDTGKAKHASAAKMAEIKRQMTKSVSIWFMGYLKITTEFSIKVEGFKTDIDNLKWIVEKATHNYAKSGGLTTQIDLEAENELS